MPPSRFRSAFLFSSFAVALGLPQPAKAALIFCNRTQNTIDAAFGYRGPVADQRVDSISEGWWRIEPGQCARAFNKPLTERFYYYYATAIVDTNSDRQPTSWKGKYLFCTDTKAFRIEGDTDCEDREYQVRGFQEIDVGTTAHDYTLDFHDEN